MEVNLCIPTLNRYDLLVKCLESAEAGTLKPINYYIIDNGTKLFMEMLPQKLESKITLIKAKYNLG